MIHRSIQFINILGISIQENNYRRDENNELLIVGRW